MKDLINNKALMARMEEFEDVMSHHCGLDMSEFEGHYRSYVMIDFGISSAAFDFLSNHIRNKPRSLEELCKGAKYKRVLMDIPYCSLAYDQGRQVDCEYLAEIPDHNGLLRCNYKNE